MDENDANSPIEEGVVAAFNTGIALVTTVEGGVAQTFVTMHLADGKGNEVSVMTEPERAHAMAMLLFGAVDMAGGGLEFDYAEQDITGGDAPLTPIEELREQLRSADRDPSNIAAFDQLASGLRDAAVLAGLGDPIPDDVALGIMWGAATVLKIVTDGNDIEGAVYVVSRFAAGE